MCLKKWVPFLLSVFIVLTGLLPFSVKTSAKNIIDNGDFKYVVLEDEKSVKILKYSGSSLYLKLPEQVDGYRIVEIGTSAFRHNTEIKELEISSSVQTVGISAFEGCTSLISIHIPSSVRTVKSSAFSGCRLLAETIMDDGIDTIDDYAFAGCLSLKSVTIPNSVNIIGESAFYNCTSLEKINFPKSLKYIGGNALENTAWMKNQKGEYVIAGDGILIKYTGTDKVKSISDKIKTIGCYAFAENKKLTELILPPSVTKIGDSAFENCTALETVYMPETISKIGPRAFYNCTSLRSAPLPKELQKVSRECFAHCSALAKIEIPSGVTSVEKSAFEGCSALLSVGMTTGLKEIKETAFKDCTSIGRLVFPYTLKEISSNAFENCVSLTRVEFNGDTKLNASVFFRCVNLEEAAFYSNPTNIDANAFNMVPDVVLYGNSIKESYLQDYAKNNGKQLKSLHSMPDYENRGVITPDAKEEDGISGGYILIIVLTVIIEVALVLLASAYIMIILPRGKHVRPANRGAKYAAKPNQRALPARKSVPKEKLPSSDKKEALPKESSQNTPKKEPASKESSQNTPKKESSPQYYLTKPMPKKSDGKEKKDPPPKPKK